MSRKRTGEIAHLPLHIALVLFTALSCYPILWVFTIAFPGKQSLAIVNLQPNPTARHICHLNCVGGR